MAVDVTWDILKALRDLGEKINTLIEIQQEILERTPKIPKLTFSHSDNALNETGEQIAKDTFSNKSD